MFENVPNNFFNLLVSKNRDLFVKSLFVLRKAVRQELYLTRDDFASRLTIAIDDDLKENVVEGDEDTFENEDLTSSSQVALYVIRKLRDYGWINIDFNAKNSLEEFIAVPSYATMAINFLYSLSENEQEEYNSLVYSTYAALKMADNEGSNFYDALVTAYNHTDKLNEALASLFYGIRSIEQRIESGIEINEVTSIHFNEYLSKLHEKYYHPYKTFDSIYRFRSPIVKLIKAWQNSNNVRKKMLDACKSKFPNMKNDAIYEMIATMYDAILTTYDNIEDKMQLIDDKINQYTTNTIDKMKHLVNIDESYKGKVSFLIKLLTDNKEMSSEICDIIIDKTIIQSQSYICKESAYNKREFTVVQNQDSGEIEVFDRTGQDVDELLDMIKEGYNLGRIKDFIVNRANEQSVVTISELNISNDEDFILAILAMIRGDEKELPFKVEFDEGQIHVKNYTVPNIKFVMKEGKK